MGAPALDAIVVGSGPNGLAAAITLAQAGLAVRVYEAHSHPGGGLRSAELTAPGYVHDVCATVHALAVLSPFLSSLPLESHGLSLVQPEAPYAHPLDDGSAVVVERSVDQTADTLGRDDGRAYRRLFGPHVRAARELMASVLGAPRLLPPPRLLSFGRAALRSAAGLTRARFREARTRAAFAGAAAHGMVPLDYAATAGFGMGLTLAAHAVGWPVARGGSQRFANALASYLSSLGGEIVTGTRIDTLDALPSARAVLCDVTPRQLIRIAGSRLPSRYQRRLERYRYGPGVFKMDWALREPVPWRARDVARAGTIHIGGSFEEIADSERAAWQGRVHDRPYVLAVQPSLCDPSRAPAGRHTLWAYCHVPHGSPADMTSRIEAQIERFAPGFRDVVISRHAMGPGDMERHNANIVGGDIAGGACDLRQLFTRPVVSLTPWETPVPGLYLCSSSTPPGVGVHGMCGYLAARRALERSFVGSRGFRL